MTFDRVLPDFNPKLHWKLLNTGSENMVCTVSLGWSGDEMEKDSHKHTHGETERRGGEEKRA